MAIRHRFLIIDTIFLGITGALGAQLFLFLLGFSQNLLLEGLAGCCPPKLPSEGGVLIQVLDTHRLWLIPLVAALGGLMSGVLIYLIAPEAEGHGTDTAVKAFHRAGGHIRARVTPVKMIASAITIGSGGAAGREGPSALFSAGIGSIYATLTKRSDKERRLLVLIGMAAGLSAIFRSPIGTAFFAIEVLYSDMEFDADALLYTLLGSIIAYTVNGISVGWEPLFKTPEGLGVGRLFEYVWYALLGLCGGIIGTLVPSVFYHTRDFFRSIPVRPIFKPAIGGLGVGIIALMLPQVLGGGYGWIQLAMDGQLTATLLFLLIFGKMIAFALTVGSGGSGGVFAPTLFVGAMLGGFIANILHQPPAPFIIIGMAAVFGSAARVPIATLLMVTEMTDGYHLLAPAALAVALSYIVQTNLSARLRYKSLYEAQVKSRADSPAHRMEHVKTAIKLLSERQQFDHEAVGNIDILALLESGVPLALPEGKNLNIGRVGADSPCAGTAVKQNCLLKESDDYEIVAVFREEHLILPHPRTVLETGDELLVLASSHDWEKIKKNLSSPS
jgi:CIC family chloride channel protein